MVLLPTLSLHPPVAQPDAAVQNIVEDTLILHQGQPLVAIRTLGHGQHQILLPFFKILPAALGCEGIVFSAFDIPTVVDGRVRQVDESAQVKAHLPQVLGPAVLVDHQKLRHELAEAARWLVGIGALRLFQGTEPPDAAFDGGALAGVGRRNFRFVPPEDRRQELCGIFSVIVPVVPGLVGRQGHIHPGRVADVFIVGPGSSLARMGDAAAPAVFFIGFVKAHEQQSQKRHVIAQAQSAELSVRFPDGTADAAVDRLIAVFLFLAELFQRGNHESKHLRHLHSLES